MSNYIQFKVAHQTLKADGKQYKAGDPFPFEAGSVAHKRLWQQGAIVEENVTPKAAAPKAKRGNRK